MSDKSSEGYFSLMGEGEYGVEAISAFIVSWSLGNLKISLTNAEQCGLVSALMDKNLSSKPFSACLIAYHVSVYLAMLIEFSDFPSQNSQAIRSAIILELYKIKDARDMPIYLAKEAELIDTLIQNYSEKILASVSEGVQALNGEPGRYVMGTVQELYDLDNECLEVEAIMKFPLNLNASIASVYRMLIEQSQCQWSAA